MKHRIHKLCNDRFAVESRKLFSMSWKIESVHSTAELALIQYNILVYGCVIPDNVEYVENKLNEK